MRMISAKHDWMSDDGHMRTELVTEELDDCSSGRKEGAAAPSLETGRNCSNTAARQQLRGRWGGTGGAAAGLESSGSRRKLWSDFRGGLQLPGVF